MATANSITPLFPRDNSPPIPTHSERLVALIKIGVTVTGRCLLAADCPDVRHLVERAHFSLEAARDLIESDRELAA